MEVQQELDADVVGSEGEAGEGDDEGGAVVEGEDSVVEAVDLH